MSNEVRQTFAGALADLYGDPEDPNFAAVASSDIPNLEALEELQTKLVTEGVKTLSIAVAAEIARLRGERFPGADPGYLYGAKAGIWQVH